jgi:CBS domain-containing protein
VRTPGRPRNLAERLARGLLGKSPMRINQLMTKPVKTCHPDDSGAVAARIMWDCDVGAIPVVDDHGQLIGMITDRDLCMAAYHRGAGLHDIHVSEAMNRHVVTCPGDSTETEVAQLMAKHRIRRIPIVDDDHRPIGIVSINDLAVASDGMAGSVRGRDVAPQTVTAALAAITGHRTTA